MSDGTDVVDKPEESVFVNLLCWKLLNTIATNGQVERVKEVFDMLSGNFAEVHTMLLGPLVKVHAKRFVIWSTRVVPQSVAFRFDG